MAKRLEQIDNRLIKALSHPLRRRILTRLGEGKASPNQLSEEFGESLTDVAYHFRELAKAKTLMLVELVPRRGATEHFYKVRPSAFIGSRDWSDLPAAVRVGLGGKLLREFLSYAVPAVRNWKRWERPGALLHWLPVSLDDQGWEEMTEAGATFLAIATKVGEESTERLGAEPGISVIVGAQVFEAPHRHDPA